MQLRAVMLKPALSKEELDKQANYADTIALPSIRKAINRAERNRKFWLKVRRLLCI